MIKQCLFLTILACTLAFPLGTVLASECVTAPVLSDQGEYMGCDIIYGDNVETRDAKSTSPEACLQICKAMSEMDEMADESRQLDILAHVGG
jgi:hypothetical protein